jgi:protein-arginine deiminase
VGDTIQLPTTYFDMLAYTHNSLSYIVLQSNGKKYMIIFFGLPKFLLQTTIDYHQWVWHDTNKPHWILLPNLTNQPEYYFKLQFKQYNIIRIQEIIRTKLEKNLHYLPHNITFKFLIDTYAPITVYEANGRCILGQELASGTYIDTSEKLDVTQTYYISCNELISRKTQPLVYISIGVYSRERFLFSDQIIFRIAPIILTPNNLRAETIYIAELPGAQNNQLFIKDVTTILHKEKIQYTILRHQKISMYHRWMQDILKFCYVTDGTKTSYIILKGPRFSKSSVKNGDMSYIYEYFKEYPHYDFFYEKEKNLDAFGNIQVTPPIHPKYPFGRIIYGISANTSLENISYSLVDLLEAQQVQKPIHLNTGWLTVGHIDEIVSFVPDPKHRLGFRILLASPRKFSQLISQLDPNTVLFDNIDNYYVFHKPSDDVKQRFNQKYDDQNKFTCLYKSQLKVVDILNWTEMINDNQEYQKIMDHNRQILISELGLIDEDFYEVPIYYWPKSLSPRAKSILPNMVNNLYTDQFMLVPKPFGPTAKQRDIFEQYFTTLIPQNVRIYFVRNWDAYFLLDGDINCGTNVKRHPFSKNWWYHMPSSSYNV